MTSTTATTSTTWKADLDHSSVTFIVRNFLGTVSGRCNLLETTVRYDEKIPAATVDAVIDAASIATGSEQRDGHLRSEELLDTANHPTIAFHAEGLELDQTEDNPTGRLTGRLTVRDNTREVSLRLRFLGRDVFPLNGAPAMVIVGETEISRDDFGVPFNMPWNNKMLISDTVNVRVELLLLLEQDEPAS